MLLNTFEPPILAAMATTAFVGYLFGVKTT